MKPIDKKIAGMIMALMVVVILFLPAYAAYEIEQRTVTHIQTVEGLYENGTVFSTVEPIDKDVYPNFAFNGTYSDFFLIFSIICSTQYFFILIFYQYSIFNF